MLDPTVNIQFLRMKEELSETKKKLKQSQEDLEAIQFNPQGCIIFSFFFNFFFLLVSILKITGLRLTYFFVLLVFAF